MPSAARIAAPLRSVEIACRRATAISASAAPGTAVALGSDTSATIPSVSLGRASWLAVVGACAIATILLALNGYSGYSITAAAVGLAAAVNLL